MEESPWRAYFGQINKSSSSRKGRARHPVVVALTVISIISIITAALVLRVHRWYYGEISVLPLCNDNRYKLNHDHAILPVNEALAYSLSLAVPPVIVLCIEFMYLIISLDEDEKSEGNDDEVKPRFAKGLYLFLFRFLHFTAALILTAAFVSILVDITKIVFNWPRPYFLKEFPNNCNPSDVINDPRRTLSQQEINARHGFPSYRVALLSGAAILLSVHSTRTLRAMRSSGPLQTLIVFASFLVPLLAAASVLTSHENRSEDVIVGLLIGVISATYMTSMLPTKVVWHMETLTSKSTRSTIEELNSFVPMRQTLTAYNAVERTRTLQRHSDVPASTNQPVPLPGLTSSGGGLIRAS